ncbi:hypothetical protein OK016_16710 [Vibrio chagasii]|nr:hypothetical protein [Vibrio chagasii]
MKLGNLMNFVSKSVITGFVTLAILIFYGSIVVSTNVPSSVYLLVIRL